jgi:hypothetical protein
MKATDALKAIITIACCMVASGCGQPDEADKTDLCVEVSCARGTCDSNTGECGNATACLDSVECLEGFVCVGDTCIAELPCETAADCAAGICVAGACVNPAECTADLECLEGYVCFDRACSLDPCLKVDCARGVCEQTTGECTDREACTEETQDVDCLGGNYCYEERCRSEEEICTVLDCSRGVCSFAQRACVDSDGCVGNDMLCLEGNFCNDEGQCQKNACDRDMISCDRGVCEPATGACVNAPNCGVQDDCIDGHVCVGDVCTPVGQECGADGCPGNQVCEYDAVQFQAICVEEDAGCTQALDCRDDRVCTDGLCSAPETCVADPLEPNDTDEEALVFHAVAELGAVRGTICAGDVDTFSFHTRDDPLFTGVLLVDLSIDLVDVGIGEIRLELIAPDGSIVADVNSMQDPSVRIEFPVGVLNLGQYFLRVSEPSNNSIAGLRYQLTMDMVVEEALRACAMPKGLTANATLSGDTNQGSSYSLGSTCTSEDNFAGEDIYEFLILEESHFTANVDATDANSDLSMAVRSVCAAMASEVACASGAPGNSEKLETWLQAGRHYLVVQGEQPGDGGPYTINASWAPVVCQQGELRCLDASTSESCKSDRTGFDLKACSLGCNAADGRCIRAPTDVCHTATDATGGLVATIQWSSLANDYDPGSTGCVANSSGTQTNGPDAVFSVTLLPEEVVDARLDRNGSDFASLYAVTDCSAVATSCLVGSNLGRYNDEALYWINDTGSTQTIYIIADVENDTSYSTASMTIDVYPTLCSPGEQKCNGINLETCNALGAAYDAVPCTFGCDAVNAKCTAVTNDSCSTPIDLLGQPNSSFMGRIEEYTNTYSGALSCITSTRNGGPDAVFSITPASDEVITVTVDPTFDALLWVSEQCSSQPSCLVGTNNVASGGLETVQFLGTTNTTYYIFVDSMSATNGIFTVSATSQPPTCPPSTILGCTTATELEYCGSLGVPLIYTCTGNCTNNACASPTGQACVDPIQLVDGSQKTGAFTTSNDINPGSGASGACNFSSAPNGADTIYAVDMLPGEILTVDYTTGSSFGIAYLLSDCGDTDTCLANTISGQAGQLQYSAQQQETIYVVSDRTSSGTISLNYTIDIQLRQPDCTPGQPAACAADGITLEYCDGFGFSQQFTCNTGCANGACTNPSGDLCVDANIVTQSGSFTGNFSGTNAQTFSTGWSGSCYFDASYQPKGRDTFYRVDLSAGDLLTAQLASPSFSTATMYIMENCLDDATCQTNRVAQGPKNDLSYVAAQNQSVYVVVDATSTASSTSIYDLDIVITPGLVCAPDVASCLDTITGVICDPQGAGYSHSFLCSAGCAYGGCNADSTSSDGCGITAPDVGDGIYVQGQWNQFNHDVSLTSTACTGRSSTAGPDIVHAVTVNPGEILYAKVQSLGVESSHVYAITDCANPTGTCVAGGPIQNYQSEFYYATTTSQTLYVVAQGTSSAYDEAFTLLIKKMPQVCAPGTSQCSADGVTLEYCNGYGTWSGYACTGGCTGGTCASPTSDHCLDPKVMTHGTSDSGNYEGSNIINLGTGAVGACSFGASDSQVGTDHFYRVDLLAGQKLTASFTTTSGYGILSIMGDCSLPSSCLANTTHASSGSASYTAASDESVIVVMDRTLSGNSTLTFTVNFSIQ